MKFMINSLLTIILTFSINSIANVGSGDKITAKKFKESTLTVGTIQQSLLTETQFQSLQGNCWVKMIGQDVSGSDYATITGRNSLPDTRGRFARAIGGQAPALGYTQEDAFQGHAHDWTNQAGGGNGSWGTSGSASGVDNASIGSMQVVSDGVSGTPRTSAETRPKNFGVNFFIKINHNCN